MNQGYLKTFLKHFYHESPLNQKKLNFNILIGFV